MADNKLKAINLLLLCTYCYRHDLINISDLDLDSRNTLYSIIKYLHSLYQTKNLILHKRFANDCDGSKYLTLITSNEKGKRVWKNLNCGMNLYIFLRQKTIIQMIIMVTVINT